MNQGASTKDGTNAYRLLAAGCIVHAATVLALWLGVFVAGLNLIPGKLWLLLTWLWVFWPVALLAGKARSFRRVAIPVSLGLAVMVPCIPTIFAFTVWYFRGFAP